MQRSRFLAGLIACAAATIAAPAWSQASYANWPERAVTVVVPWPAGGFTDKLGRLMAEKMALSFGKPVVVENKPGASAGIGSEFVMRAPPDGYTLCVTSTDGTVKLLQGKGTSPVTEFTQISMLASQPVTLSVGPKFKGNSLKEFIDEAKKNPGSIAYASNGEGGATHYGMEIFAKLAGVQLNHIPYKGTAPALQDLVGGQIESTLVSLAGIGSQLQAGRARALAITAPKRVDTAPNIPTFAELGYPSFDLTLWYGMTGPKGLPEPIVRKINQALKEALASPDVQKALRESTADPIYSTPEQMLAFVQKESARWSAMIK